MDAPVILSSAAIILTMALGFIQIYKFFLERKRERQLGEVQRAKVPVEKESIIVGSAENAVIVLNTALNAAYADAERARSRIRELETRLDTVEAELRRAKGKE